MSKQRAFKKFRNKISQIKQEENERAAKVVIKMKNAVSHLVNIFVSKRRLEILKCFTRWRDRNSMEKVCSKKEIALKEAEDAHKKEVTNKDQLIAAMQQKNEQKTVEIWVLK